MAEVECSYLEEIDKINANADEVFRKSDEGKKFALTHKEPSIIQEGFKRHRALVAELNTQIKSIKNSTDSEIAHLESEKITPSEQFRTQIRLRLSKENTTKRLQCYTRRCALRCWHYEGSTRSNSTN